MKKTLLIEKIVSMNRKFHIYTGLFLMLFILLFSFSGLLLNHSGWKFASFWNERKEKEYTTLVTIPVIADSLELVQHFMKQLHLSGEVSNVLLTSENISFRVVRPGISHDVIAEFKQSKAIIKEMTFNLWGKLRALHTFNGSDRQTYSARPNWPLTQFWRLTMDVLAVGLIILCLGGWIMWYKARSSYPSGLIFLIIGFAGALLFLFI